MDKCANIFHNATTNQYTFVCFHCCEVFYCANLILEHLNRIHYNSETESITDSQSQLLLSETKVEPAHANTITALQTTFPDLFSVDFDDEQHEPYETDDDERQTAYEPEQQAMTQINDHQYIAQAAAAQPVDQIQSYSYNDEFDSVSSTDEEDIQMPPAKSYKPKKKIYVKPKIAVECDYCGKVSYDKMNLLRHMRNKHLEKPVKYKCNLCPKTYYYACEFVIHKRRHRGEKPYQCTWCGMKFITACALKNHENKHLNPRFECTYCGKKVKRRESLRRHEKTHSDERLYGCTVCEKRFKTARTLSEHMKIHDPIKRYQCGLCPMAFATFSARRGHERNKHLLL